MKFYNANMYILKLPRIPNSRWSVIAGRIRYLR